MSFLDTNTIASVDDFAAQLTAFAVAQGGFVDEGKDGNLYRISKDGIYWNYRGRFYSAYNQYQIEIRMSTIPLTDALFNSPIHAQNNATIMHFYGFSGPLVSATFYAHSGSVHAAVELGSGIFSHISLGTITKIGDYVGGQYVTANAFGRVSSGVYATRGDSYDGTNNSDGFYFCSHPDQFDTTWGINSGAIYFLEPPRTLPDNDRNDWANFGVDDINSAYSIVSTGLGGGSENPYARLRQVSSNSFNGRVPLFPLYIYRYERSTNTRRILGYVDGIRYHHFTGLSPRQILDDEWEAFPAIQAEFEAVGNTLRPAIINRGFSYKRT